MYAHPPKALNQSDPMFSVLSVPRPKEFHIKTDAELANDKPDDGYASYTRDRNLRGISESQKLAKLLQIPKRTSPVPKEAEEPRATTHDRLHAHLGEVNCRGEAKPYMAFVECCCGPDSLLTREAQNHGLKTLRFTKSSHD